MNRFEHSPSALETSKIDVHNFKTLKFKLFCYSFLVTSLFLAHMIWMNRETPSFCFSAMISTGLVVEFFTRDEDLQTKRESF